MSLVLSWLSAETLGEARFQKQERGGEGQGHLQGNPKLSSIISGCLQDKDEKADKSRKHLGLNQHHGRWLKMGLKHGRLGIGMREHQEFVSGRSSSCEFDRTAIVRISLPKQLGASGNASGNTSELLSPRKDKKDKANKDKD